MTVVNRKRTPWLILASVILVVVGAIYMGTGARSAVRARPDLWLRWAEKYTFIAELIPTT